MIRDGHFRKAESSDTGGCVEVAALPEGGIRVRDSRNPAGQVLACSDQEWEAFIAAAKTGDFDLPAR
jgi:Domain of unknown function (DUF397)